MKLFTSTMNIFKYIMNCLVPLAAFGQVCAFGIAVWAFFYPRQAAVYVGNFQEYLAEARADIRSIEESNQGIEANTKAIGDDTSVLAKEARQRSSLADGLDFYLSWTGTFENDASRDTLTLSAIIGVHNTSTTPLYNVEILLLDANGEKIWQEKVARLDSINDYEQLSLSGPVYPGDEYRAYFCVRGDYGDQDKMFNLQADLKGDIDVGAINSFSSRLNMSDFSESLEPTELCRPHF